VYLEGERVRQGRFDQVSIAPGLDRPLFRGRGRMSAEDDDAGFLRPDVGAEPPGKVKPGCAWERHIRNHSVWLHVAGTSECILGVGHCTRPKSHDRQREAVHVTGVLVIVDNQYDR
jgi:hypothetical protein